MYLSIWILTILFEALGSVTPIRTRMLISGDGGAIIHLIVERGT